MTHEFSVQVGPVGFRVASAWARPVRDLRQLYAGYPAPRLPEHVVRLAPERPWRRWLRPSVAIDGGYRLPEAAPLPLAHGLLAAEMGMNLQVALGHRRHLLLHAAAVERGGRALLLTGESGSGKSTLSALLSERGWRFMGDEFALIDPDDGLLHPFPRPISLKNEAIGLFDAARLGPLLAGTPKGSIRHLAAPSEAIARMAEPAAPALVLFPRFGEAAAVRPVGPAELFVRLTQASTNYVALGERGFDALARLVTTVPAFAVDYRHADAAFEAIEALW